MFQEDFSNMQSESTLQLMSTLERFYTRENFFDFLSILNRKNDDISLRICDWFSSNYSRAHNTRVRTRTGDVINVYLAYKNALRSFSKKQFDPFCRRTRIRFEKYGIQIVTTIGQLNFFRFALCNGIVDFIRQNIKEIEAHMIECIKTPKVMSSNDAVLLKKKRTPLSVCAAKGFCCSVDKIVISFD